VEKRGGGKRNLLLVALNMETAREKRDLVKTRIQHLVRRNARGKREKTSGKG